MKPDGEVRLMGAYIVKCNEIIKDNEGNVVEIHCTADLETGNGNPVDGRKIKGTIHWVSAKYAIDATVRLYDYLFTLENVNDVPEGTNYLDYLNPNSLTELTGCKLEPALAEAKVGDKFQFVRTGYFCKDSKDEGVFAAGRFFSPFFKEIKFCVFQGTNCPNISYKIIQTYKKKNLRLTCPHPKNIIKPTVYFIKRKRILI